MTANDPSTSSELTISSTPSLKLLLVNASGTVKRKQDDTKYRIKALVDLIEKERPDLVFFVEFMWQSVREKVWKNTGLSKEYVLYLGEYSKQACFLYNENRIEILAIKRDDFIYNKMSNEYKDLLPRSCQIKIRWDTEELVCICWHGPHTTKKAEDKGTLCTLFKSYLHELQEHKIPVILGGDFNLDYHKVRTHFPEPLYFVKNNSTGRKDDKCFFITSGLQYTKPVALDWKEKCSVKNAQDMFDHDPILTCLQHETKKSANITSSLTSHDEFTVQELYLNQGQGGKNSATKQTISKKQEYEDISGDEKMKPPDKINQTDVRDGNVFGSKEQELNVQHQDDDNIRKNILTEGSSQSVILDEKLDSSTNDSNCNLDNMTELKDSTDYGKPSEFAAVPNLPFDVPENIKNTLSKLMQSAKTCSEGKHDFLTEAVDSMLLEVDLWSRKLEKGQRSRLYSYLAVVLPLTQSALSKRSNKLNQLYQLKNLIKKLGEEVNRMMPDCKERYRLETERIALQKRKECGKDEQSNNEDNTCNYRKDSIEQKKGTPKMPRRKFPWTENVRSLLCQIVQLKLKNSDLTKKKPEKANQILKTFFEGEIVCLWPKFWMQTSVLLKESKEGHKQWTSLLKKKTSETISKCKASTVTSNNEPNQSEEKKFANDKAALPTHASEFAVKMEPSLDPPIIKQDPEKGGYRDKTHQEDYAPREIVTSGKLQQQQQNTPSGIVTVGETRQQYELPTETVTAGKTQQQQHITPSKIVSPGKKLHLSKKVKKVPEKMQQKSSISGNDQKRASGDSFTDDEGKPPCKISRADEEIREDSEAKLPKVKRTSVSVCKEELLLMLRLYQTHKGYWNKIIDDIKEKINTLPLDIQQLYKDSSNQQIKKRLSSKLNKLSSTSIDDEEIRSEVEQIQGHKKKKTVPDVASSIPQASTCGFQTEQSFGHPKTTCKQYIDQDDQEYIDFSREEKLLLLDMYQIHKEDWPEIIRFIKLTKGTLPQDAQRFYEKSSTEQMQKRLSNQLNEMLSLTTIDDPEIRYEVEQIRSKHKGITPDVSLPVPQASGFGLKKEQSFDSPIPKKSPDNECINFSRVELLLLLRTYQRYPNSWNKITEVIKEAINVLPNNVQLLYNQSSTEQIQERLSRQLNNMLSSTTFDDPEIRSEIENIRSQQ